MKITDFCLVFIVSSLASLSVMMSSDHLHFTTTEQQKPKSTISVHTRIKLLNESSSKAAARDGGEEGAVRLSRLKERDENKRETG